MANPPKFEFYEKVRIAGAVPDLAPVAGKLGAVLGRAENEDGSWGYAVHVYDERSCWDIDEEQLEPTGEFDKRETFYDGTAIRVSPEGELLE